MRLRLIRLRFRRSIRKSQKQFEDIGQHAERGIERHVFKRFGHLARVRRFVIGWLLLMTLLISGLITQLFLLSGYYQTLQFVPGGIYNEGIVGRFTNANPLFATNDVDSSVSKLIFASLFTYNDKNQLVGDLAKSYSVDTKGTTYTVHLKPYLTWQDGKPLTSKDVVFTYKTIQDPDTESPLQNSYVGVGVSAPNPLTVIFKLPDPLTSFPYSLTNGIVPEHLLAKVDPVTMRSVDFNTVDPVGSGPFSWQAIQVSGDDPITSEEQIALTPFAHYQGGAPKLSQFVFHVYAGSSQLAQAFKTHQLDGAEGFSDVPGNLQNMPSLEKHSLLLSAATMVFFKTSSGVLADSQVRQALVQGANVPVIISQLGYLTRAVREPLLMAQLGYNPGYKQHGYNLAAAKRALSADGWLVGKNGMRFKNGTPLSFNLTAADTPEYHMVVNDLQSDWEELGVHVQPLFLNSIDLQSAVSQHDYDSVLYGISIGVDPDVFVYWDSSQADIRSANRLNLSEYKNSAADDALEAGRTRQDPALRVIKYQPFLQQWQSDNPALGLYQPRLLYLTDGPVKGLDDQTTINTATDRFDNVQNWEIDQAKVSD
jgi:peptide/nickel transport system substrate-binding protein